VLVERLKIQKFRCLEAVDFTPHPETNVMVGANGSGKTSVLEALYFLGRGRSFRAGPTSGLIQRGAAEFTVYAQIAAGGMTQRVGVEQTTAAMQGRIDGNPTASSADLAAVLPVQVIDPEVHELVQGGPKERRQFVDWGVFHVKHEFLVAWRRYRRALLQRNQGLRQGLDWQAIEPWDRELISSGLDVDRHRRQYLEQLGPELQRLSLGLLDVAAEQRYRSGWPADQDFASALDASRDRDRGQAQTHVGPHRAELVLEVEGVAARHRLSRGQQKLLAISMILAQSQFVAEHLDETVVLLVDEPAAELDAERLSKLVTMLGTLRAQLFISALDREALPIGSDANVFHVERGSVSTLL
jgi:DNA replication and repair protein RecF